MKKHGLSLCFVVLASCGCANPFGAGYTQNQFPGSETPLASAHQQAVSKDLARYPLGSLQREQRRSVMKGDWKPPSSENVVERTASATMNSLTSAMDRAKNVFSKSNSTSTDSLLDPTKLSTEVGAISPDVFITAARLFEQRGQTARAVAQYQKALEFSPGNRLALIGYARLKHRAGNLQDAVNTYREVLSTNPNDAVALNDLGLCYARQGLLNEAVASLSRATQVEPTSKLYRNNIATVLLEAGNHDQALAHLQQAFTPAESHFNMAQLLMKKSPRESATHLVKALEFDPGMSAARQLLAQLQSRAPDVIAQVTTPRLAQDNSPRNVARAALPDTNRSHRLTGDIAPSPSSLETNASGDAFLPPRGRAPFGYSPPQDQDQLALRAPLPKTTGSAASKPRPKLPPVPQQVGHLQHDGFEYRGVPRYLPPVE